MPLKDSRMNTDQSQQNTPKVAPLTQSNEAPELFSVETNCPLIEGVVRLTHDRWTNHMSRHGELEGKLECVESTVKAPSYVAESKPGPKGVHKENLVFVDKTTVFGTNSYLHVFVKRDNMGGTVRSAIYCNRDYHGPILWSGPEYQAGPLKADYDQGADVLYLYVNEPAVAISEAGEDGILLRYRIDDARPCGVTVLSYRSDWSDLQDRLADRVSEFLHVGREATRRLLSEVD